MYVLSCTVAKLLQIIGQNFMYNCKTECSFVYLILHEFNQ